MATATRTVANKPAAATKARTMAPSRKVLTMPVVLAGVLALFSRLPQAESEPALGWSLLGASGALLLFAAVVAALAKSRTLRYDVSLRPQHYLQACAHTSILLYWGWYWRPVYGMAPLIAAQLVFAYAFDMLLQWSRHDDYQLGFGPFPIIFSTNLFLWFKPEWFFLQFLMIAVGFAAKELIRWERDGRRTHIFNPSSFTLALFSLGLILTGRTSMTFGEQIATTQFNPPNMYLFLFLIGLPGQFLFGVTTMTMSAVVTTYLFGLGYFAATGTYFFIDSYIPIAVFLGMHLLFTDPSTSPRSELGRIIFGVLYGLGNVAIYALFTRWGIPAFYDKLLPVPLMNLSVRFIDRLVRTTWVGRLDPARVAASLVGRPRNVAYIAIWVVIFGSMSATQAVGDHHPGHRVPFWQNACVQNRAGACATLGTILNTYCADGSGWACNELGALKFHGRLERAGILTDDFSRACSLGFPAGCANAKATSTALPTERVQQAPPQVRDFPVILRTGKGALRDTTPFALYQNACEQGFLSGCESLGGALLKGEGTTRDPARALSVFTKACADGFAPACSDLGLMHYTGEGVPLNRERGLEYLKQACGMGMATACRWYQETTKGPQK